ncbi:MAG: DUF1189 domain-containing protein, partial [Lachnospiraceae bacterium]|nr:DUF1189 domain-containing protein [Lachnospiraceae bacterium]
NYGGNPEPQKAPNIFQQFVLSFIPPQYNRLTKVKTGSMIGFVTLLSFVSTVIIFAFLLIVVKTLNMSEWVDQIPDFEVREGQFHIEEDFEFDMAPAYIYLTDDVSEFSFEDAYELADEGYWNIILVGRDRLSLMQNGQYNQADFSDLDSDIVIDKDMFIGTVISFMKVFVVMGFVIFFVGRIFWYFLCAAVYLLIAMFIASVMMKKQLSTGTLFRVAVYSKVLMFVVATFLDISVSIPFLFRVAVTVVFMGFAIAKLPEEGWR